RCADQLWQWRQPGEINVRVDIMQRIPRGGFQTAELFRRSAQHDMHSTIRDLRERNVKFRDGSDGQRFVTRASCHADHLEHDRLVAVITAMIQKNMFPNRVTVWEKRPDKRVVYHYHFH